MVGVKGLKPSTSRSQTERAINCATPRGSHYYNRGKKFDQPILYYFHAAEQYTAKLAASNFQYLLAAL